jgi:hypothetical protein
MNIDDVVLPYQLPIFFLSSIKITEDVRTVTIFELFFSGGYNYLHIGKPGLDMPLADQMALHDYVRHLFLVRYSLLVYSIIYWWRKPE